MKKTLILYFRPDSWDLGRYPFFCRMIEKLVRVNKLHLVDMSGSEDTFIKQNIHYSFCIKKYLIKIPYFRRFNKYIFFLISFLKSFFLKPDHIILIGAGSIDLVKVLKRITKSKIIYVDDEFPWVFRNDLDNLENQLSKCDLIISLDELRHQLLQTKLPKIQNIPYLIAPNIPADKQLIVNPNINWVDELGLDPDLNYLLYHGEIIHFSQITEILTTLPLWNKKVGLIILGWKDIHQSQYGHLLNDKVFFCKKRLDDPEYNSLIKFCIASFGLYTKCMDLEYAGMSSGKIMRAILLNKPVITNNYDSFKFIAEGNMGIAISHPIDIPEVLDNITFLNLNTSIEDYDNGYNQLKLYCS